MTELTGPYDSVRDYFAALEATGNLVRIPEMDSDEFETTAFCYRIIEKFGYWQAPAFLVERVKINGEWVQGPLVGNAYGPWAAEALGFGVEDVTSNHEQMYRKALDKVSTRLAFGGFNRIAPKEISPADAPVKEVILSGDDIDITKFAFIQSNPADAGRYITTGSVILHDDELGRNVGTYRCQIKGPRQLGVNPEPGQDGWRILMAKKARGEKVAHCSIVVGADPILFATSSSKIGGPFQDELSLAGGLRDKPVEVVKSETSDLIVPAHAEMVIEGEIPLDDSLPEGPFAELYGYLGKAKTENFYMNITRITHRHNPIIINAYTGVTRGFLTAPMEASFKARFKMMIPGLQNMHIPTQAMGIYVISIDKTQPGQGMSAGHAFSASFGLAKVTIVVDKDVNIYRFDDVLAAIGSRWQPYPAATIIRQTQGMQLDPSAPRKMLTSKIVIDATRQMPIEGGPEEVAPVSKVLLMEGASHAFDLVDSKWDSYFASLQNR